MSFLPYILYFPIPGTQVLFQAKTLDANPCLGYIGDTHLGASSPIARWMYQVLFKHHHILAPYVFPPENLTLAIAIPISPNCYFIISSNAAIANVSTVPVETSEEKLIQEPGKGSSGPPL